LVVTMKAARRTVAMPIAMQATGTHDGMSMSLSTALRRRGEAGRCCCRDQGQRGEENIAEGGADVEEPVGGDAECGATEERRQKD